MLRGPTLSSPPLPESPSVSIVLPAYNEAERIGPSIARIAAWLDGRGGDAEILVVDDGSEDETGAIALREAGRLGVPLRVLRHTPNRGKGHAVRIGMLAARGRAVLMTDVDLSVPIETLDGFLERLGTGADVVIGSRRTAGARVVRHQPALRERLGAVFTGLAGLLLVPGIDDFTCGFKLFRREAAQAVFAQQRLDGWGFDVEVLLIAHRLGLSTVSAPVEWTNDERSRVRLGRDILRSAGELLRIRWNDLRGRYGPGAPAGPPGAAPPGPAPGPDGAGSSRGRGHDGLVLLALLLAAAAILVPLRPYGLQINDDGWYLHPTLRMIGGETLYRDIHTFYAPFEHHLFAWILGATGPSLLVARSVWILLILLGVAGVYAVARRFAPPGLAVVPAAVFALVPGQWSKAFYTLCTVAFLLALARFIDRRSMGRAAVVGLSVGFTLITRHDLGLAQAGLSALALLLLAPGALAGRGLSGRLRLSAAMAAGALVLVLPVGVHYAAAGALTDMLDAMFVRGAVQRTGSYATGLALLFSPGDPLHVTEGRIAGALLLLPSILYLAVAWRLWRGLLREGLTAGNALVAAILLYALAGLLNTWYQMRLLRLLETGAPFYLLATWLVAQLPAASARLRALRAGAFACAGGGFAALVIVAVPSFLPSDDYSGSLRALRFDAPVSLYGETFYVTPDMADEIRMVRSFIDANTKPGDPVFVGQIHSLYYLLLGRSNPTRILGSHLIDDRILTDAEKEREMARLLASPARFVVADQTWLGWPGPPDPIRRTLIEHFHPVRQYGSMTILERGSDPYGRTLGEIHRRLGAGRIQPGDLASLERLAAERPDAPLPRALQAIPWLARAQPARAARVLEEAAPLDPENAALLESAARFWLQAGRLPAAAQALRRALAIRESAASRDLLRQLEDSLPPAA